MNPKSKTTTKRKAPTGTSGRNKRRCSARTRRSTKVEQDEVLSDVDPDKTSPPPPPAPEESTPIEKQLQATQTVAQETQLQSSSSTSKSASKEDSSRDPTTTTSSTIATVVLTPVKPSSSSTRTNPTALASATPSGSTTSRPEPPAATTSTPTVVAPILSPPGYSTFKAGTTPTQRSRQPKTKPKTTKTNGIPADMVQTLDLSTKTRGIPARMMQTLDMSKRVSANQGNTFVLAGTTAESITNSGTATAAAVIVDASTTGTPKPKQPRRPRKTPKSTPAVTATSTTNPEAETPIANTKPTSSGGTNTSQLQVAQEPHQEICPDGDFILKIRYCSGDTLTKVLKHGVRTASDCNILSNSNSHNNNPNKNTSAEATNLSPLGDPAARPTPNPAVDLHGTFNPGGRTDLLDSFSPPSLQLKVSSAILSMASPSILKKLTSPWISYDHVIQEICPSQLWGIRESPTEATLVINADQTQLAPTLNVTITLLFNILHFKTSNLHRPPVLYPTAFRVIELSWMLGCIEPVLAWSQVWISGYKKWGKWPEQQVKDFESEDGVKVLEYMLKRFRVEPELTGDSTSQSVWMGMSWAMGDEKAFEQTSRDYMFAEFTPQHIEPGRAGSSQSDKPFGIEGHVYDDLCSYRLEFIRQIYAILNDFFTQTRSNAALSPPYLDSAPALTPASHIDAILLGSLIQSVMKLLSTNFPLEPTSCNFTIWQLWERVENIVRDLDVVIKPGAGAAVALKNPGEENPVTKLRNTLQEVWPALKGLKLKDYRPDSVQVMDFYMGCVV